MDQRILIKEKYLIYIMLRKNLNAASLNQQEKLTIQSIGS